MKLSHSLLVLCMLPFVKSQAIEIAPGDFEPLPAGANGEAEGFPNPTRVYRAAEFVVSKRFSADW